MTIKTKECKFCKKTISSPKRIPICDACRNSGKQWTLRGTGIGLALLGLIKTQTDKKN
jgi:hypothetical protein